MSLFIVHLFRFFILTPCYKITVIRTRIYCGINAVILIGILIILGLCEGIVRRKFVNPWPRPKLFTLFLQYWFIQIAIQLFTTLNVRNIHCVFLSMQREKSSGDYFVIQTQTTKARLNYCAVPESQRAGRQTPAHGDLDDHK